MKSITPQRDAFFMDMIENTQKICTFAKFNRICKKT